MMDRRAKERLVGASLLVALVVLVVPEFLSGPKPAGDITSAPAPAPAATPPVRTYTVDLADNGKPSVAPASSSPPPPATAAQPATAAPVTAPDAGVHAAPAKPPPAPPVNPPVNPRGAGAAPVDSSAAGPMSPVAAARSSNGGWAVQMGSFASEENADKLAHQLKGQGYPVYVLSNGTGANLRHRVRLGPLADRDAAVRLMAKLKAQGHAASLVAP